MRKFCQFTRQFARVYVCYWGPVLPPKIMDDLDLSKSTAYDYIDWLVDLDLLKRDASTRPQQLTAEPVILVEPYTPTIITPTVLHAFALQEVDEDVEYFLADTVSVSSWLHSVVQASTMRAV